MDLGEYLGKNVVKNTNNTLVSSSLATQTPSLGPSIKDIIPQAQKQLATPEIEPQKTFIASLFGKIMFFLTCLIITVLFIYVGKLLIDLFVGSLNKKVIIVNGKIDSNNISPILTDPNLPNSKYLLRSNNERNGMEYTWSFWLNVLALNNPTTGIYNHIFNVGNNTPDDKGIMQPNNAPGVYLTSYNNPKITSNTGYYITMRIVVDTMLYEDNSVTTQTETGGLSHTKVLDINDIPLQKWFHVALRLENTGLDVYINGSIIGRMNFSTVPKQNYYNIFIRQNGGFNGSLSDLVYYSYGLSIFEINNIVNAGPTLSSANVLTNVTKSMPSYDYLSSSWYNQ